MAELIITEKPKSALKIAHALADGKIEKESNKKVPYYRLKHGSKEIIVAPAVGHLYGLVEKEGGKWKYPVFEIEWKPNYETSKSADFTKNYYDTLKKLCKNADSFTVATDYDVEGEVIGLNVVRYICKQKDASRMKFSTLTKNDLVEAYEHKSKTLDWGQAMAGETRHKLDWYWGINTSRALTSAIKSSGMFKILSSGRVQGPALKIIVDKEKEIRVFKSVPYWQIELNGEVKNGKLNAWHKEDKFWEKEKADNVMENVRGKKTGIIDNIEKTEFQQIAPAPFDLTALQIEAYRVFRISPKDTLSIAQNLYLAGLISYPRTSSQQLPYVLNYKKIISMLANQKNYSELCKKLLEKDKLFPRNGKKTDPAHPACHPTGEIPKKLDAREQKIYDLIVRRTLATFGEPATRETVKIDINVNNEMFIAKGTRTTKRGWHIFYGPYLRFEEKELPAVLKGEEVKIIKIKMHDCMTQPPKRYTPSSIIKELEKKNLGTKATRASIVDTLFERGYVKGEPIEATELGLHTIEILEKYSPTILDEELTRHFEMEMDEIREKTKKPEEVLDEAEKLLTNILQDFKKKEKEVGQGLREANIEAHKIATTVGKCPTCREGELVIRKGKFGRFIACNKYPDCSTTFKLPATGIVEVSDNICEKCQHPMIMIKRGRKSQSICINHECSSKQIDESHPEELEKKCPKCGGRLVLRKSIYGSFYGCSAYPKCRHIEKILNGNNKK